MKSIKISDEEFLCRWRLPKGWVGRNKSANLMAQLCFVLSSKFRRKIEPGDYRSVYLPHTRTTMFCLIEKGVVV